MTTLKISYVGVQTMTITASGLVTDPNALGPLIGRQSTAVDNHTSVLADDYVISGLVTVGASPAQNSVVEIYLFSSVDLGSTYSGAPAAGASDAAYTAASVGGKTCNPLLISIQQTDTTGRAYTFGGLSVANAFGGTLPTDWGIIIYHNTNANLGTTTIKYQPIVYTNA